jgi:predicted TIM-barrel fold metal-dependent hydrolase
MNTETVAQTIDVEQHVLVPTLDDLLPYVPPAWQQKLVTSEFQLPPTGPHPGVEIERHHITAGIDPEQTAADLAPGTLATLLIAPQPLVSSGWLGHEMAAVFHRAVNDYLIDRWLGCDRRFYLAASVSVHDIAAAVAEVRRIADHPQVGAVVTSLIAINMGHKHYHPLFEVCQENGLPLVVHPGGFEGSVVGPAALAGVGPRTPEETFALLPQVAMSNVSSLIFDGVFSQFPGLTVVFAGFGYGWVPPVLWRADSEWRGLRVEVPWLVEPPSEVAARNIRFVVDGACDLDQPGAWKLAEMLPEQSLLYGSDRPYVTNGVAALAEAPEHLRRRIELENAAATFPRLRIALGV